MFCRKEEDRKTEHRQYTQIKSAEVNLVRYLKLKTKQCAMKGYKMLYGQKKLLKN
jgi:hypothetical protein